MQRYNVKVQLEVEQYIAHPYWPAREEVISIEKDSGMNRCRSQEKRDAALKSELDKRGLTLDDYERLKKEAAKPFYTDDAGEIIIPRHQLAGALVETIGKSPKNVRGKFTKDNFRSFIHISDFRTGKTKPDGVFDRFVKLETSNMRNRQRSEFIEEFVAVGSIKVPEDVEPEAVERLFKAAIEDQGVGASRKMGYGRGRIIKFEVEE